MPYVDQGQPKTPTKLPPILPIVVVIVAMGVSVLLYVVFYKQLNYNLWLAPLVTGPLIGLGLRLTAKRPLPKQGLIAILAALTACLVGYVYRHVAVITWTDQFGNPLNPQPGIGNAFEWLFSADLLAILMMGMSAYLAFAIGGVTYLAATTPRNEQAS